MFVIKTKRLILRDLLKSDWRAMHQLRSDPDVTRFMDYIKSESEAETRAWVQATVEHNARSSRLSYNLAVARKRDGEVIGWIGIGQARDRAHGELDFGYALLPDYWGEGYMTDALGALLSFAFEELEAQRIFGECAADNFASRRVMEKVGLRLDQPEQTAGQSSAETAQDVHYSICVDEWQRRK